MVHEENWASLETWEDSVSQVNLGLKDFKVSKATLDLQEPKDLQESQDQQGHQERLGHLGKLGRVGYQGRPEREDRLVILERRVTLVYLVASANKA